MVSKNNYFTYSFYKKLGALFFKCFNQPLGTPFEKFGLKHEMKFYEFYLCLIKNINLNNLVKFMIFFIGLYIYDALLTSYENLIEMGVFQVLLEKCEKPYFCIRKYPKLEFPKLTLLEKNIDNKMRGHYCIYEIKKTGNHIFFDATPLTTLKDADRYSNMYFSPYKYPLEPELRIPKGVQAISGTTKRILLDETTVSNNSKIFEDIFSNSFNVYQFHNSYLSLDIIEILAKKIQKNNIYFFNKNIELLNESEQQFYTDFVILKAKLPKSVFQAYWSPYQKELFSPEQAQKMFILANEYTKKTKNNLSSDISLNRFFDLQENLLLNFNYVKSSYFSANGQYESLVKELQDLPLVQTNSFSDHSTSGCLGFPFAPVIPPEDFEN